MTACILREIWRSHIESGMQEFGPHVGVNHPRIGTRQFRDCCRGGESPEGIKLSRYQFPFLEVFEEGAQISDEALLGCWPQRFTNITSSLELVVGVLPDGQAVHASYPFDG